MQAAIKAIGLGVIKQSKITAPTENAKKNPGNSPD